MKGPATQREMMRQPKYAAFSVPHNPKNPFSTPPLKPATRKMARGVGGPVTPIVSKRSP